MHRGDDGPNDLQLRSIVADRFGKGFVIANYLAHISNNRRYLYVSVPKVGCTKIKRILQEAEYGHLLPNIHQVHEPIFSPLLEPIDDIKLLNAVLAEPDWTRFTFARNPFTRVLSCYMDKIVRSPWERQRLLPTLGLDPDALPSFAEFLECVSGQDDLSRDIHWASQHHLARPDLVDYTFVGRFERFTEDLRKICDTLGITPLEPLDKAEHHLGATGKLAEFYGERERRLVAGIYECDFEVFGYDPSDLPRQ